MCPPLQMTCVELQVEDRTGSTPVTLGAFFVAHAHQDLACPGQQRSGCMQALHDSEHAVAQEGAVQGDRQHPPR